MTKILLLIFIGSFSFANSKDCSKFKDKWTGGDKPIECGGEHINVSNQNSKFTIYEIFKKKELDMDCYRDQLIKFSEKMKKEDKLFFGTDLLENIEAMKSVCFIDKKNWRLL